MELLDFLRSNPEPLKLLEERYGVTVKRHSEYPNLVLLKYNQIESDPKLAIVRQCRGIIVDEDSDWKVVCYSYSRFGNVGEGWTDKVDWSASRIYDKIDGSLCQLYYYDGKFNVATSGMPDAAGEVGDFGISFKDLFWTTWLKCGYSLDNARLDCCYAFELMTDMNRLVVQYDKPRIVLHGARDLTTLQELNPVVVAAQNGWECVKTYGFNSIEEVVKAANELKVNEGEGFVVCDMTRDSNGSFKRIKVKSLAHVNLSHLRQNLSARGILEVVRSGEGGEAIAYFPQLKGLYDEVRLKYEKLVSEVEGFYAAIKSIDDRKTYASFATQAYYSGILFGLKFGGLGSVREGLMKIQIKNLEGWLGLKE